MLRNVGYSANRVPLPQLFSLFYELSYGFRKLGKSLLLPTSYFI